MLKDFFEQLTLYYNLENDLSNFTVALCNSNDFFKEKFIHYFFPDLSIDNIHSIEREVPDKRGKGSRVDILIQMKNDDKPYLIEVKIGDQNHHFGQYEEAYEVPKERLGYITNYVCVEGKEKGYDVKTWEGFYRYLASLKTADILIIGYMKYLSQLCGILDVKQKLVLNDDSFKNNAIDIFSKLCSARTDKYVIKRRNRFDRDQYKMVDFYYGYNPTITERPPYYATIEFNFADPESQFIRLFVTKNSNPEAFSLLLNPINSREGRTFDKGMRFTLWGDNIGFQLKSKLFNVLSNPDEQMELLKDFMEEFLMRIKP
jgi:hypothetical protein